MVNLLHIINIHDPALIFHSEPQLFHHDIPLATKLLKARYSCSLNSDNIDVPDLGVTAAKTHGGTMTAWKRQLDPYVVSYM